MFILLIIIVFIVTFYGLVWCIRRHTTELGYQEIALFAFTSGLPFEHFVFPSPLTSQPCKERIKVIFSPRIRNDLDFLLMRLFRADAGIGQVFKDIQINKEMKHHLDQDHELLHLFVRLCVSFPCDIPPVLPAGNTVVKLTRPTAHKLQHTRATS